MSKKTPKLRPLIKIHGGKGYLHQHIISLFPNNYEDYAYVEPFIGGGSVYLNKKPSTKFSVINDINPDLYCLWYSVKAYFSDLIAELSKLEYKEETFKYFLNAKFDSHATLARAIRYYVVQRMSRGGLGKNFAWSERLRGGQPGDINAWETSLSNLKAIHRKIGWTPTVLCCDFEKVLNTYRNSDTLYYLDPPYISLARTAKKVYDYEMDEMGHERLLKTIQHHGSKILLSGYDSDLYNDYLIGWNKTTKEMPNHSGQGKNKQRRVECFWDNYTPPHKRA